MWNMSEGQLDGKAKLIRTMSLISAFVCTVAITNVTASLMYLHDCTEDNVNPNSTLVYHRLTTDLAINRSCGLTTS